MGKDLLQSSCGVGSVQFFVGSWTEGLSFLLSVSQKLPLLPYHQSVPHMASYFLKTIRKERVSSQDGHYILCHYLRIYIKKVYCHLYCIQLIRNKNSSHSHSRGENNQRCKHQKAGILGTTLESVYHTYYLKSFQCL